MYSIIITSKFSAYFRQQWRHTSGIIRSSRNRTWALYHLRHVRRTVLLKLERYSSPENYIFLKHLLNLACFTLVIMSLVSIVLSSAFLCVMVNLDSDFGLENMVPCRMAFGKEVQKILNFLRLQNGTGRVCVVWSVFRLISMNTWRTRDCSPSAHCDRRSSNFFFS